MSGGSGEVPVEQLRDLFTQLGPSAQEVYMTTAETLRREGEERGIAKGRAEGIARGVAKGRAETWTTRILTAHTLRQVLP